MGKWWEPKPKPPAPPAVRTVAVVVWSVEGDGVNGAIVSLQTGAAWLRGVTVGGMVTWPEVAGNLTNTHLVVEADGYVTLSESLVLALNANQQIRIGTGPDPNQPNAIVLPGLQPVVAPIIRPVVRWPSVGASYYTSLTDPDVDIPLFARWLKSVRATYTRVWLLDAWALGTDEGGLYDGYLPIARLADGRFDLSHWDEAYVAHLRYFVDEMNREGVWPHLTVLELYAWSQRKAGMPYVPDPNLGPYRNNVNGVRWGDPDDPTFFSLPDAWLTAFIQKVVQTLDGASYAFEIGNEMPEKEMHDRIRDAIRAAGFAGEITCNRNEDTPGQYWNMGIDRGRFDRLSLHGKLDISYLDTEYPEEAAANRPTTFREMWPQVDPARVILSSDGGGGNPVHLDALREVACDALQRGGSYEHQLALKRNRFFGDGTLRMSDLAIDAEMLRSLPAPR